MKAKRHAKILELIHEKEINTQEELLQELEKSGFVVTQATVSRDIKELRLVKSHSPEGRYSYVVSAEKEGGHFSGKYRSILRDAVFKVDYSENIVVIKCYTGMAQAACAAIDSMKWDGIVGTLAGEDTIFVVARSQRHSQSFTQELTNLIAGNTK